MNLIGGSISDAIDWAQDLLATTRPLAEKTLFALLADAKVYENEDGFMLLEDDEEEVRRQHDTVKHNFAKNWQRYRFHVKRRRSKMYVKKQRHHVKIEYVDTAQGMLDPNSDDIQDD